MVFGDGLRRLRSAPQFRFDDVAAASGLSVRRLRRAAASRLVPRGRCAQAAVVAVSNRAAVVAVSNRAAALTHRTCPPYAVHAAGFTQDDWQVTSETPGAAGWAIRGASSVRTAHRSAVMRAAVYGGDDLRERAVANRSCLTGVRARLVEDPSESVRRAAVTFGMAPASARWVLAAAAISDDAGVRRAVAGRVDCPQHLLNTLAADPDSRCRSAIALCREVPEPALRRFAHDPDSDVRNALARRRPLAAGTAAVLAEDSDVSVRVELASNETCPPGLLERLADDTDDWVRDAVASNEACPPRLIRRFRS